MARPTKWGIYSSILEGYLAMGFDTREDAEAAMRKTLEREPNTPRGDLAVIRSPS